MVGEPIKKFGQTWDFVPTRVGFPLDGLAGDLRIKIIMIITKITIINKTKLLSLLSPPLSENLVKKSFRLEH